MKSADSPWARPQAASVAGLIESRWRDRTGIVATHEHAALLATEHTVELLVEQGPADVSREVAHGR